ncbi:unnamed protein product [Dovyalis caffra]|uniref:Glycosyltransferase n=1 Tax=Dovyalis caffra TaxID=77055 RepID=A0AAV1QPV1_9ROSI|nr:unnamed protein product [Dovyalis caffra]
MSVSSSDQKPAHVALLPSAGMGHLTPFLRLAALLSVQNVQVTFITPYPTVSLSESQALSSLFASFPQITRKQLHLLPLEKLNPTISDDPFYYHFDVIRQSSHLLSPLLSSLSPPLSAFITDMSLASVVIPITEAINLPNYVLFTTSAKMMTLFLSYHITAGSGKDDLHEMDVIKSGLEMMPKSWIPPPLLEKSNNSTKSYFIENGKKMIESSGILVNTFESFEKESLRKLNHGEVIAGLPSVIPIGPLAACDFEKSKPLAWLDGQPAGSILYVSFGSRTALSRDQVRELGEGLVRSGIRFLWVVKDKKVDRQDNEELEEVIGHGLMEKVKEKGLVVKNWLNQEGILGHKAIGGFLSHCGWNSVMEAVWHGVPILAWPQHGDQKVNANVVERNGMGIWVNSWGWGGEIVVTGAEIAGRVQEIMRNESLRGQAMFIREEARKAVGVGGSSNKGLTELIGMWKKF